MNKIIITKPRWEINHEYNFVINYSIKILSYLRSIIKFIFSHRKIYTTRRRETYEREIILPSHEKIFARYGWRYDSQGEISSPRGGPSNKVQSVPPLQINEHENFTSLYIQLGAVPSRETFKSAWLVRRANTSGQP